MLLLISLILELCIRSIRLMFQLGDLLIGLVDAFFSVMTEMPCGGLCDNLCFVRRLNRRVFPFDLMDFAVNAGSEGVTDLADGFVCLKLQLAFALGLFQLILKMKAGFALSGLFIKDTLFLENLVRGQLFTGSIQTLMCLLRLPLVRTASASTASTAEVLRSLWVTTVSAITVPVCEETPCCSKTGGLNGVSDEGSGSGAFWGGFSVLFSSVTDVSEGG